MIERRLFPSLIFSGRLRELVDGAKEKEQHARTRGNLFALTNYCSGYSNLVWLIEDNVDLARKKANDTIKFWSSREIHLQHMSNAIALAHIGLYENKGPEVQLAMGKWWKSFSRAGFYRALPGKDWLPDLIGRVALSAWTAGQRDRRLIKEAAKCAKMLAKDNRTWPTGMSRLIRGQIAALNGTTDVAIREFESARKPFESADMALYVAVAKYAQGKLMGGDEGAGLMAEAHRYLEEQQVVNHESFLGIFIPWIIHGMGPKKGDENRP